MVSGGEPNPGDCAGGGKGSSSRGSAAVGVDERLPDPPVDAGWWFPVVVAGEGDGEVPGAGSLEFGGSARPVVAVRPPRCGHGKAQRVEHGGRAAGERTGPAVALPDVVKEPGPDRVVVVVEAPGDGASRVDGVTLVRHRLTPEERLFRIPEEAGDPFLFGGGEWSRPEVADESGGEVGNIPGQTADGHPVSACSCSPRSSGRSAGTPCERR